MKVLTARLPGGMNRRHDAACVLASSAVLQVHDRVGRPAREMGAVIDLNLNILIVLRSWACTTSHVGRHDRSRRPAFPAVAVVCLPDHD